MHFPHLKLQSQPQKHDLARSAVPSNEFFNGLLEGAMGLYLRMLCTISMVVCGGGWFYALDMVIILGVKVMAW